MQDIVLLLENRKLTPLQLPAYGEWVAAPVDFRHVMQKCHARAWKLVTVPIRQMPRSACPKPDMHFNSCERQVHRGQIRLFTDTDIE